MKRRGITLAVGGSVLLIGLLLAPVLVLWLPGSWKYHVYHEISFQVLARNELSEARTPEEVVRKAIDFTRRNIWVFPDSQPYSAKSFEYLVNGIGWCDYQAKVLCCLLAARGLHARYAFLIDRDGVSPHTVAEVYLHGAWRAVDPLFSLIFAKETGEWATLEELTPDFIESLPDMVLLGTANPDIHAHILELAKRTFPLPRPPHRSDDFLKEKHPFDGLADAYVAFCGKRFAEWYQDQFLRRHLATIQDPNERLWQEARNYQLYRRFTRAEPLYRALLARELTHTRREQTTLFLSRLLRREARFWEAREVLEAFLQESPQTPWVQFQLALCYEGLHDTSQAIAHYEQYQQLRDDKFAPEVLRKLARLHPTSS
ncbi:MAG: hypothetical protein HYZ91_00070 [Candidatus Omnitrophica bacterium]|nr:hypothetical protein [Candidatus Omnitrophota bacterium]